MYRTIAALVAALSALAPPAAADEPTPDRAFSLVYSGGLRGLSGGRSLWELPARLEEPLAAQGRPVVDVQISHGVLATGEWTLFPLNGAVATTRDFADAWTYSPEVIFCGEPEEVTSWRTPTERLVAPPGVAPVEVPGATVEARAWRQCTAGPAVVILMGPPGRDVPVRLDGWELRDGFRWWFESGEELLLLGRPRRAPARRIATLQAAVRETPDAAFVDAGSFLDAHDPDDPIADALREAGLSLLARLGPAALGIGASELSAGVAALQADAERLGLPYVATNLVAADGSSPFSRIRVVELPTARGPVTVAFLAVVPPAAAEQLPALAAEGYTIRDPLAEVAHEVDRLRARDEPVDLVVLLAHADSALQRRLRSRLYGIDLFIGDETAATFRVDEAITEFRQVAGAFKASPVTLPMDGIAVARIDLGDAGPRRVAVHPLLVGADSPADVEAARALGPLHASRALAGDRLVLAAADGEPLAGVADGTWKQAVCEALLGAGDADIAFVAGFVPQRPTPGGMTERQLRLRLPPGDRVEVHRVDGDRLPGFLGASASAELTRCGVVGAGAKTRIGGRPIVAGRTYRVVTTDGTRQGGRLEALLPAASSNLVGHRPKSRPLLDADGRPRTLRSAVMEVVQGWPPPADGRPLRPTRLAPQWTLHVEKLSFRVVRFEGAKTDRYAAVPETLLNSPSSLTLGGDADLGLTFSSQWLAWELRGMASYARLAIAGVEPTETADDWRVSAAVEMPFASIPPRRIDAAFRIRPYLEALLDSEFTPAVDEAGVARPLQADLYFLGGLSAVRNRYLHRMRLGGFVSRDLAQPDRPTDWGARFDGQAGVALSPATGLGLTGLWDVQVFGDTAEDDASDLRLRLFGEIRLGVRVVRWLRVGLFAQGLLVSGRVEETKAPAGTATLGASLDFAGAFLLNR